METPVIFHTKNLGLSSTTGARNMVNDLLSRPWLVDSLSFDCRWTGGLIYFTIFRTKFMVINDPKISFELLDKRSTLYSDRPKSVMIDLSVSFLTELEKCRWNHTLVLAGDLTWHSTTTVPNGRNIVALCIRIWTIELFENGVDCSKMRRQSFWRCWKRIQVIGSIALNSTVS